MPKRDPVREAVLRERRRVVAVLRQHDFGDSDEPPNSPWVVGNRRVRAALMMLNETWAEADSKKRGKA